MHTITIPQNESTKTCTKVRFFFFSKTTVITSSLSLCCQKGGNPPQKTHIKSLDKSCVFLPQLILSVPGHQSSVHAVSVATANPPQGGYRALKQGQASVIHTTNPNLKLSFNSFMGAGIAQWLERQTRDWKVAGSNPCWNGGRIFFSRVDFLCWLLFRYLFHPRVTTVARKKSRSFCQKCRWQVTAKHAYTLRMWLLLNRASALVTTCP